METMLALNNASLFRKPRHAGVLINHMATPYWPRRDTRRASFQENFHLPNQNHDSQNRSRTAQRRAGATNKVPGQMHAAAPLSSRRTAVRRYEEKPPQRLILEASSTSPGLPLWVWLACGFGFVCVFGCL